MAEVLFSSDELKTYLSSIDFTVEYNKKVLAGIQSLHVRYMNQILYYLIKGRLVFSDLTKISVNNLTAEAIIESIVAKPDDTYDRVVFYRSLLNSLPEFKNLVYKSSTLASNRVAKITKASKTFVKNVVIDNLGLTTNSYTSMTVVRSIYDNILLSNDMINAMNLVATKKNALEALGITSIDTFSDTILDRIAVYLFINDSESETYPEIGTSTIIGSAIRSIITDLQYNNLKTNINNLVKLMAVDYNEDIPKNGWYSINKVLDNPEYSWNSVFNTNLSITSDSDFLDKLGFIIFLRKYVFANIYGPSYSTSDKIAIENNIYNAILEYFEALKDYAILLVSKCSTAYF